MTTPAPPKYRYFISYSHERGFGNTELVLTSPITTYEHVAEIGNFIARNNGWHQGTVVVMHFQPFGEVTK